MASIKDWLGAFRLRTLPLSLSSIALGSFLALEACEASFCVGEKAFSWTVFVMAIVTTLFLQILSNLANDYGDSQKGADNEGRIGPQRAVQSGAISPKEMFRGMVICAILALVSGLYLVYEGTKGMELSYGLFFVLLGLGAIGAAIKYTVGKGAYGYSGFGDVFVFLFFGITGVMGTFYLHTHVWDWTVLLPAASVGFLSAGVLNLNNMRDIENDAKVGKRTLVVKMGAEKARKYHAFLLLSAIFCALLYTFLHFQSWGQLLFFLSLPLVFMNLKAVFSIKEARNLDPLLKKLALTTTFFVLTFGIGLLA